MVWGVRARTTVLATALVLVTLVVTGAALVASQRHTLTDTVDEVLQRQSATIADDVDAGGVPEVIEGQGDDDAFAQVIDPSGDVIAATTNAPGRLDVPLPDEGRTTFRSAEVPGGEGEYRVMSAWHDDVVILTATPLDDVNDSVATLTRGLAVAVPAATLLLAGLVWLLVGRVLRPVEQIRSQVAEISGSSLDRRVPVPTARDEVAGLAHTMNEMLARLESSAARQQRFVADASHELRSPLARMRAGLEVDIAHPQTADDDTTRRSLLEETGILQQLVDDLLLLARTDSRTDSSAYGTVDLDDVVMREVGCTRESSRVAIDTSGVSAAQVVGDASDLARVVRNLLENAQQHGGSAVTVSLAEVDHEAVLSIADDGDGIPEHLQERVFDRFTRVDGARVRSNGFGLGLAIARETVCAMDGTITIDPEHRPGARFIVRLPLARHG